MFSAARPRSPRRVRAVPVLVTAVMLAATLVGAPPVSGLPLADAVDVERFSARAAAWSVAHAVHQEAALERAIALGEEAAAAEEAERQAALEAAATTTTTAPPATTTAPPTTAPATTTTAPPTTVPATTAPATPAPETPVPEAPAAETPAPDTTAPTTSEPAADDPAPETTTTTAAPVGGPSPEQWEALRQCESGGRYDAVNPNGRYRGAYQFSQATWDWVAGWANSALIGVDPAMASVADQDAQAQALYDRQGAGPWPHCGKYLP